MASVIFIIVYCSSLTDLWCFIYLFVYLFITYEEWLHRISPLFLLFLDNLKKEKNMMTIG